MAPPAAPTATTQAATSTSTSTTGNPYFSYRRSSSHPVSGSGSGSAPSSGSGPLAATVGYDRRSGSTAGMSTGGGAGQPPGGPGTIRYTCIPSSYLSSSNDVGWGGPHVTVGVRSLHASPVVGPMAGALLSRGSGVSGVSSSGGEEKKLDDDAGGGALIHSGGTGGVGAGGSSGRSGGWVHPFHALPYSPSLDPTRGGDGSSAGADGRSRNSSTAARSADELIAPREFTVTVAVTGLCVGGGGGGSGGMRSGSMRRRGQSTEISSSSAPLVPIALDPGFSNAPAAAAGVGGVGDSGRTTRRSAGAGAGALLLGTDPPPLCSSTHVARFDPRPDFVLSSSSLLSASSSAATSASTSGALMQPPPGGAASASATSVSGRSSNNNNSSHGEELTLPLQYRDLSRDAAMIFRVYAPSPRGGSTSSSSRLVATATLTMFDDTGRLRTGLQRLRLVPVGGSGAGAVAADGGSSAEDPLWEASLVLEGIRQTAARAEDASAGGAGKRHQSGAAAPSGGSATTRSSSLAGGGLVGAMTQSSAQTGYGRSRQQQQRRQQQQQKGGAAAGLPGPNYALPNPTGPVPWLDEMTRSRCLEEIRMVRDQIISGEEDVLPQAPQSYYGGVGTTSGGIPPAHLIIELPEFNIPIVHDEIPYPPPAHGASGTVTAYDVSLYRRQQRAKARNGDKDYDAGLSLVQILDYENTNDSHNPVEDKYRTLAHDLLRGHIDPSLKPSRAQRARLSEIISSPSRHPTNEERDLLWRFRFHLVDDRRALSKFLLAVDWSQPSEVVQAAELLEQWRSRSPIEVTDALRLLGKDVSDRAGTRHAGLVREYAIETLDKAEDGELRLYLLQLVQAIKYEAEEGDGSRAVPGSSATKGRRDKTKKKRTKPSRTLASFLIDRASRNLELANYLYWYLRVELTDSTHGTHYKHVFDALKQKLSNTVAAGSSGSGSSQPRTGHGGGHSSISGEGGGMSSSSSVHSYSVKSALRGMKGMGAKIEKALLHHGHGHDHASGGSGAGGPNSQPSMWDVLTAQDRLISGIMDCQRRARDSRGKKDAKEAFLRDALAAEGYGKIDGGLLTPGGGSVPLPSAPKVMVTGIRAESVRMFKSALYPAVVEFNVGRRNDTHGDSKLRGRDIYTTSTRSELSAVLAGTDNDADALAAAKKAATEAEHTSTFKVIVKTGDDLRQDQLVIMMIQLMDRLLKRATLDLCLRPYAILATSPSTGLVEFVDGSIPISQILANNNNSILQYLKTAAPRQGAKYGITPDVMQTYIRSCAGYCVITYLLGVGDRHLDNIMLQASGHFFHIDFGFIFGRDPKPLPPAFRLTREMVDGMGGVDSSEYARFRSLSCQAFNTLRKSAGLVLNLLHLMGEAGIEDLSNNPAADAEGVIAKVEERFRLELTDEQAEAYFLGLIDDSLNALAPRVMEVFHQLSVARR